MGSHTLIDNQACTTAGTQTPSARIPQGSLLDETCSAKQRMFEWTNSYFIDATSGTCVPREPEHVSPGDSKRQQPNEEEDTQLDQCSFTSNEGHQLGKNLQCVVHKGAEEYIIDVYHFLLFGFTSSFISQQHKKKYTCLRVLGQSKIKRGRIEKQRMHACRHDPRGQRLPFC